MTFEDFKVLTEEEQKAVYDALEDKGVLYDDMEAERHGTDTSVLANRYSFRFILIKHRADGYGLSVFSNR